jgi:hypothetical protein
MGAQIKQHSTSSAAASYICLSVYILCVCVCVCVCAYIYTHLQRLEGDLSDAFVPVARTLS